MLLRLALLSLLIASVLAVAWWGFQGPLLAADVQRPLSRWQHESSPFTFPTIWENELAEVLAKAPAMSLVGEGTQGAVAKLLKQVSWIEPHSIRTELALPLGLRVYYSPRLPALRIRRVRGETMYVSDDATLLPPGLKGMADHLVLEMPLDQAASIPEIGEKIADPLLHECLRARADVQLIESQAGLNVVRLERQENYPLHAPGVPPALTFILEDGQQILWGRSTLSQDPYSPALDIKMARLGAIMRQYPDLAGVYRVVLDRPKLRLEDAAGRILPCKEPAVFFH
jgi:hypothetical protein